MTNKHLLQERIRKIAEHSDEMSFREVFDEFYPRLLNFGIYLLESETAANEVISNVFLKIWTTRTTITHIDDFNSYLFRCVKNASLNYLRDAKKIQFEDISRFETGLTKTVVCPESQMINSELRERIMAALDSLPPRCRMIFELVKHDGMKYKEVALLLEVSINTVENQMSKALSILRKKLVKDNQEAVIRKLSSF